MGNGLGFYRELGSPIAAGRMAEVYEWRSGWVLKLLFEQYGREVVAYEQRLARAVNQSGVPTPKVGELVEVNGRWGLLYERREGETMLQRIVQEPPDVDGHARLMAQLHAELHRQRMALDIPSLHKRLADKLREARPLPEKLRAAALVALEEMPQGERLCHGDFHPGNILLGESGTVIIDWIDASIGDPLADVARTSIITLGAAAHVEQPAMSEAIRQMHAIYLQRYFELQPGGQEGYRRWLPIVAAARLSEGIMEQEDWLLAQAADGFSDRS